MLSKTVYPVVLGLITENVLIPLCQSSALLAVEPAPNDWQLTDNPVSVTALGQAALFFEFVKLNQCNDVPFQSLTPPDSFSVDGFCS